MASKLVSLYDMMRLDAKPFYEIGGWLESLRGCLVLEDRARHPHPLTIPPTAADQIRGLLDAIAVQADTVGDTHTSRLASNAYDRWQRGLLDAGQLAAQLDAIDVSFKTTLDREWYLKIDPSRVAYYEQDALLGNAVAGAFASARYDIREAGNCIATERYTAAVFHLMRAVEWALRSFCIHLGFTVLRPKNKPVAHGTWDEILQEVKTKIDEKFRPIPAGPEKQADQEFYYSIHQDIGGIRDAWRNHVMHTRQEYTAEDAIAILGHVRRLMVTASLRLSDTED